MAEILNVLSYVTFSAAEQQSNGTCETDWIDFKGKCYFLALTKKKVSDAKIDCGRRNSSLATIRDNSVNQFLVQSIRSRKRVDFWIGLEKNTGSCKF